MQVYLDIETLSLKANEGMIVAIGILKDKEAQVRFSSASDEEAKSIRWLQDELKDCKQLITWYGSGFDLPFLVTRAALHRIDLKIADLPMLDLYRWCKENLLLSSYGLESVAKFFGIRRKLEFQGRDVSTLFKLASTGDIKSRKLIIDHCKEDLWLLKEVHQRLKPLIG
jgi:uncharacterized protein YprB with RNaseH-like and TPR domain